MTQRWVDIQVGNDILDMPIEALPLSVHALNCLRRANCIRVRDVVELERTEILRVRNLGVRGIAEIAKVLKEYGILKTVWEQCLT